MIAQLKFSLTEILLFKKKKITYNKHDRKTLADQQEMSRRQKKSRIFYVNAPDGEDEDVKLDELKDIIRGRGTNNPGNYEDYFRKHNKLPPQIATMCHVRYGDKQVSVLTVDGLDIRPGRAEAEWAKQNDHFEMFYDNLMELILQSVLDLRDYKYIIFSEIGTFGDLPNATNTYEVRDIVNRKTGDLLFKLRRLSKKVAGMDIFLSSSLNEKFDEYNFTFKNPNGNIIQSKSWKNSFFDIWAHNLPEKMLKQTLFINTGNPRMPLGTSNGIDMRIGNYTDLYVIGQNVLDGEYSPTKVEIKK